MNKETAEKIVSLYNLLESVRSIKNSVYRSSDTHMKVNILNHGTVSLDKESIDILLKNKLSDIESKLLVLGCSSKKKIIAFKRIDDGEIFSLDTTNKETYSSEKLKKDYPKSFHNSYGAAWFSDTHHFTPIYE